MNQYEVPALTANTFPEVGKQACFLSLGGNINKAMRMLFEFTREMIAAHEFKIVSKCMKLADTIYESGNNIVRNAVANNFVFSFSLMSLYCNKLEWQLVKEQIPFRLYSIYLTQVMQPGS